MKKLTLIITVFIAASCSQLQANADQALEEPKQVSNAQIRKGPEQTLQKGIDKQVTKLTEVDRSYKNDQVKKAIPIFIDTIKNMSVTDAKQILLVNDKEATDLLRNNTFDALCKEFYPVVDRSFQDVGADQLWTSAISKYNNIPFQQGVDTHILKYITDQSLSGIFKMIATEELSATAGFQITS